MFNKNSSKVLKHFDFAILDILSMYISYILAYLTRFGDLSKLTDDRVRYSFLIVLLINLLVTLFLNSYHNILRRGYLNELYKTFLHTFLIVTISILTIYLLKISDEFSRLVSLYSFAYYCTLSYLIRIGHKKVLKFFFKKKNSLVIVTDEGSIDDVISKTKNDDYRDYDIKGLVIIDNNREGEVIEGIKVIATADNFIEYATKEWIDQVLIKVPGIRNSITEELRNKLLEMGITVHERLFKRTDENKWDKSINHIGKYTVLTSTIKSASTTELFLKRLMDIVGGLVGLLITLILIIIIGPIIYISSPGPIFYKQKRIGKNGRIFEIYKFRSMYLDADERKKELMDQNIMSDGMMFKVEFDPRIIGNKILPNGKRKTGIGEFIRATSLDEFPQFLNVLKGDMSLVGTRPPTLDEWEKYELQHRVRMATKPGITGMWQANGRSEITDFNEIVRLDREYISNWSIGLDIKILVKTVFVVLLRKGAK